MTEDIIKTKAQPTCPICSSEGFFIYHKLHDHLFKTMGEWSMRQCCNTSCGTLWLDPRAADEDLHKLYKEYTTHSSPHSGRELEDPERFLNKIRKAYLYDKYGYSIKEPSFFWKTLASLAYFHPAWRDTQEANIFYLPEKKGGLLLDVGCGSGSSLQIMMEKGWICKGIDFDKDAIANAQSKGLDVSHGDLFSKEYEKETFDAIIMNHVIEHVTLPIEIITECHRILKKGGVLVMITPNSDSRGHLRYKRHWRGLEVPTHLHIFTTRSLALAAHTAGFKKIKNFSSLQGVQYIKNSSAAMERNGTFDVTEKNSTYQKVLKHFSFFIAGWLHLIFPKKDDAAVVVCTK